LSVHGRQVRQEFDHALQRVEDDVLRAGTMAGQLLSRSVDALTERDAAAAQHVIEGDDAVDRMRFDIERRVTALLATQQPAVVDLRALASMMAIAIDLERLADHAEGIADAVVRLSRVPPLKPLVDIPYMVQIVRGMLHDVLEALARRDAVLAEAVAAKDDTVDALRSQVIRLLLTYMAENPRTISQALDLILVAQHVERAGDLVTNVAERVIYMVTGQMRDLNPATASEAQR
jgi:phosphate transport system protein